MNDIARPAVTLYWRPGCRYCTKLRQGLDRLGLTRVEINIWEDNDGAAVVRGIANGNETVPTVIVGEIGYVNPSPDLVARLVRDQIERSTSHTQEESGHSPTTP